MSFSLEVLTYLFKGDKKSSIVVIMFAISIFTFAFFRLEKHSEQNNRTSIDWTLNYVSPESNIASDKVYTFLCETIIERPTVLTNTCADFGQQVTDIEWEDWGAFGASGKGIYRINNCDPDCADGNWSATPVKLKLDRLTTDGSRYLLNILTIFSPESNIEKGIYEIWDLASFYREVPKMRG